MKSAYYKRLLGLTVTQSAGITFSSSSYLQLGPSETPAPISANLLCERSAQPVRSRLKARSLTDSLLVDSQFKLSAFFDLLQDSDSQRKTSNACRSGMRCSVPSETDGLASADYRYAQGLRAVLRHCECDAKRVAQASYCWEAEKGKAPKSRFLGEDRNPQTTGMRGCWIIVV